MGEEPSLKLRLPAGVFDSSFASLATFAVGLAAVNYFDDVDRGVYAVFFTAFVAGTILSSQFIFTPPEIDAVEYPIEERLSFIPRNLAMGLGPCLLGSLASLVAMGVTSSYSSAAVTVGLAVTSAVAIVISPMQDHVRNMLHIASESWSAAAVSVVQLTVSVAAILTAVTLDIPAQWMPFGALALANSVSLVVGVVLARARTTAIARHQPSFMARARRGVWFALGAAAPALSAFGGAALIAWLASPEDLGYAESARVVAQPVLVVASGLRSVLHPRSIRAAMDVDLPHARRMNRIFVGLMAVVTLGYLAVAGWDWALNPMAVLVPSAYVLGGLVALTILGNAANSVWYLMASELAGGARERALAWISWAASAMSISVAFTAGVTGAYARPIGSILSAAVRYGLQRRSLVDHYSTSGGNADPDGHKNGSIDDSRM
ncbi:MAG: hypothetical protein ACR2N7_13015 [Acidimicrobiia bacterium]